ncbi:hypothetical protein [Derxia lacustris]|uniref:hypothetical protein n=1 Tax=Derxia lacustris TaxID=764842 RepID=UPI00111C82CA|nr:hypothetical protein [Derxia lacustris]
MNTPRALRLGALALPVLLTACAGPPVRYEPEAWKPWQQRCARAGVFIHRTVDNVEGVLLMKPRPARPNLDRQFDLDDPYGNDVGGDEYIAMFLRSARRSALPPSPALPGIPPRAGYRYVEMVDPADGRRYRYSGELGPLPAAAIVPTDLPWLMKVGVGGRPVRTELPRAEFHLRREPAPGPAPRYGVTWEDISTREERQLWIAGSSLKVVDLQTGEVIAERIGYMARMYRSDAPWHSATDYACPGFTRIPGDGLRFEGPPAQAGQTQVFVEQVLRPAP